MEVKVVIGSNAGDEGKGLMTDYFAHKAISEGKRVLNILTNGGPQRGHTVTTSDGKHHVFHHFGSGIFAGADTYCNDTFIVNPLEFQREAHELQSKVDKLPKMIIDPLCRFTTPYDMIVNRIREEARGDERHGSCGMGIWETVQRYARSQYGGSYLIGNMLLLDRDDRKAVIILIRILMEKQLVRYGFDELPSQWKDIWDSDALIENYLAALEYMEMTCVIAEPNFGMYDTIIYENGQGLLLSESEDNVHTTPSVTGLLAEADHIYWEVDGAADVEVCYVSRTYLTRHGAGDLPGECGKDMLGITDDDETNVPNPYQGTLRYAPLNVHDLTHRVNHDFWNRLSSSWKCSLAFTHMNEVDVDYSSIRPYYYKIYGSYGKHRELVREE